MNQSTIKHAIEMKKQISFYYHNNQRIAEPHVLGLTTKNEVTVLTRQVGGYSSSGGLPDWRMFHLNEILNLKIIDKSFPVSRTWHNPYESNFQTVYAVVKP